MHILILLLLLITSNAWSAPDITLSVSPSATAGTVITANDENTRNAAIVTWANSHSHADINTFPNTIVIGDGTAGNKTIEADNADATNPFIRYNDTTNEWEISNNGTTASAIVSFTGGDVNFQTATSGNILVANGTDWNSVTVSGSCTMGSDGQLSCSGSATALDALTDVGTAAETAGLMLIADGTDYEGIAISGDMTVSGSGVATVVANSISLSDLSDVNTTTATTQGNILIADGTDFESVGVNGDCTMDRSGRLTCSSSDFNLISKTTVSNVNTSGAITLTAGRNYLVIASLTPDGVGGLDMNILFNNDTGANYGTINGGFINNAHANWAETAGASNILLISGAVTIEEPITIKGTITYSTKSSNPNRSVAFLGEVLSLDDGSDLQFNNVKSRYTGAADVTSFTIISASQTFSGNIYLYELTLTP